MSIVFLLNSVITTSQTIEHYDGDVHVDMDKHEVNATFTLALRGLSEVGQLKPYLPQSAKVFEVSSKSKFLASNLPSLYQLRNGESKNQQLITHKGACLLYELENRIGRKVFADTLKEIYQNSITKTPELLQVIESEPGSDLKNFAENKLGE